jgi:hypothetical protein
MRFLRTCASRHGHTTSHADLQPLSSPPRLLCRSPGPVPSVASMRCLKPHLSRVFKPTPAHNDPHTDLCITDHIRHRARRPDSRVRTAACAVAVSMGASTRVCGAPSAGRPRRRHSAATAAAASAPPPAGACTAVPPSPPPGRAGTPRRACRRRRASAMVPVVAAREQARASAALLLLQARRAAPAATPRQLSLGGVEVDRARSRGRGGRHRSGRGHGGPRGRHARRSARTSHTQSNAAAIGRERRVPFLGLWRCEWGAARHLGPRAIESVEQGSGERPRASWRTCVVVAGHDERSCEGAD